MDCCVPFWIIPEQDENQGVPVITERWILVWEQEEEQE